MLISGKWRQDMTVGTFVLERPGDYIVWGPGIEHTWHAGKCSVMPWEGAPRSRPALPVGCVSARRGQAAWGSPSQDGDLMPQHEQFDVLRRGGAGEQHQPADERVEIR
jgi:hypothetical protein